jgi:hypothetical protein
LQQTVPIASLCLHSGAIGSHGGFINQAVALSSNNTPESSSSIDTCYAAPANKSGPSKFSSLGALSTAGAVCKGVQL